MVHATKGNAHLSGDMAAAVGLAITLASAAFGGASAGNGLLLGFAFALIGALLGGRGVIVFMTLALTTGLFFAVPSGANAWLTGWGLRPRDVWRNFMPHTHFGASAVVVLVFAIGLARRGPTASRAAVETADDIEAVVTYIGKAASWLFLPMMIIIFYDITQRTIVNNYPAFINSPLAFPSAKMQEMQWHLHGALFMLCLGFAYVADAHVRIELVRDRLPPPARVWLELLGSALFLFAYCAVMVRFGFTFTERAFITGEASSAPTGLSGRWIIKSMLPLGFVILGMTGISSVLRCLVYLFGPDAMKPLTNRYAGTHHADLPEDVATRGPITD